MLILYLEDNPQEAKLVSRYVQTTPHRLIIATDAREARTALDEQPNLVMVDIVIGHSREGQQFIQELHDRGYPYPIIVVTGLATPKDLEECQRMGVNHILRKPFAITELAQVIHQYSE